MDQFVSVEIDLDDELLLQCCLMAHEHDMTLNQWMNMVLKKFIDEHKETE